MWRLPPDKKENNDLALITEAWQDFLFYDGPVLFTGLNSLKARVIGSLVECEKETKQQKYVHAVIDKTTYLNYLNKRISYPDVLRNAKLLYAVVWSPGGQSPESYRITFDDIPAELRPEETAYCPDLDWEPSHLYPVSLDGKLAALHQSTPEVVSQVLTNVAGLYRTALERIGKARNLITDVRLIADGNQGMLPASFQMNYGIYIEETAATQPELFDGSEIYFDYVNDFITYCLYDLTSEAVQLIPVKGETTAGFEALYKKYAALCRLKEAEGVRARDDLKHDLLDAFEVVRELSSTIGPFYSEIVLSNVAAGKPRELGIINEVFNQTIEDTARVIAAATGDVIEEDLEPRKYEVYIYALNTDSRLGFAQVRTSDSTKIPKPKIKILGDETLIGTKYTRSLHASEYIEVRGKARKVNNVIRSMDIFP